MEKQDRAKKQVPLRLNARLWEELNRWAAEEFRSLNGQIEYLLTECARRRRGWEKKEKTPEGEGDG